MAKMAYTMAAQHKKRVQTFERKAKAYMADAATRKEILQDAGFTERNGTMIFADKCGNHYPYRDF